MKVINGKKFYSLQEVAEVVGIPFSTLYLKIRANEESIAKGGINRYPTPVTIGQFKYWVEEDIPYFSAARFDKVANNHYKSSYQKLRDKVSELEDEIKKLKEA